MILKGGHETQDPRLDRVPQFDERSRSFPIRELIDTTVPKRRYWRLLERLDQGREGACVGFGWAHELNALPFRVKADNEDARSIYKMAQRVDEWPGEQYEGTSVLAGAKVVQERGHIGEYRWAFGIDDVLATLSHHGPVVIGVNWYRGMYNTGTEGFIVPSGDIMGGHCVALRGVAKKRGRWYVVGRNSWGEGWGVRGDFALWASDLERLLGESGDACVPVVRHV